MLYTTCPDCRTTFRVTVELLRQADGQVRCGQCATVFSAFEELTDEISRNAEPNRPVDEQPAQTLPEPKEAELEADSDDVKERHTTGDAPVAPGSESDGDAMQDLAPEVFADGYEPSENNAESPATELALADQPEATATEPASDSEIESTESKVEADFDPEPYSMPADPTDLTDAADQETASTPLLTGEDESAAERVVEPVLDGGSIEDLLTSDESGAELDLDESNSASSTDEAIDEEPHEPSADEAPFEIVAVTEVDEGEARSTSDTETQPDVALDDDLLEAIIATDVEEPEEVVSGEQVEIQWLAEHESDPFETFGEDESAGHARSSDSRVSEGSDEDAARKPKFSTRGERTSARRSRRTTKGPEAKHPWMEDEKTGGSGGRRWLWLLAATVAGAALLVQFVHHFREEIVTIPLVGPQLERFYGSIGLPLPRNWEPDSYEIVNSTTTSSPVAGDVDSLTFTAELMNVGRNIQPLPLVHLKLTDRWDRAIAARYFHPNEYLADRNAGNAELPAGGLAEIRLDLIDPGPGAYGFEVDVCLAIDDQQMQCSSDDVFR